MNKRDFLDKLMQALTENMDERDAFEHINYYDNYIDGSEPSTGFDCEFWKKDLQTGEWAYLPDITPVDKSINRVEYDWQAMTASIYINDLYRPGPYVFDCTSTWTEQDCINAINSLDL